MVLGVAVRCRGFVVCGRSGDRDSIVRSLDGDGQRSGGGITILVGDGVGISLGQRLAKLQALHFKIAVVEREAVAAISVEHQSTVRVGNTCAPHIACHIGIAAARCAARSNAGHGRTVGALNVFAGP